MSNTRLIDIASRRERQNTRSFAHAATLPTTELSLAAMAHWPACGGAEVVLTSPNRTPARRAHIGVSIGVIVYSSAYWVAHFWERDTPQGVEPAEWFLVSQWRLRCAEDAFDLLHYRPDLVSRFAVDNAQARGRACEKGVGRQLSPSIPFDRQKARLQVIC